MVGGLLGFGVAGEGQGGGLDVDFEGFVRDIGGGNGEEDIVLRRFRGRRALSPRNCEQIEMLATR